MMPDDEIRCGTCGKLLARGQVISLHIRCPRCRTDNHVRAMSPNFEGREPRNGVRHDHASHF